MTRNERKRAASAKREMLQAAVTEAFTVDSERKMREAATVVINNREDVYDSANRLRSWAEPVQRFGIVQRGTFVRRAAPETAKRDMVTNKLTGRKIERKKSYIA